MATRTPSRRGRPPRSDGQVTQARLLDAAAAACVDHGFDGATLQEIGRRAGVTATAIYNHFGSREDLLYAAGVRGLQRITDAVGEEPDTSGFAGIAAAYLRPDMADARRLLAELHLASRRDARLKELLGSWHRTEAARVRSLLGPDDPAADAAVKTLFLVLLGLCHLEDLDAVEADPGAVTERVTELVRMLRPPRAGGR